MAALTDTTHDLDELLHGFRITGITPAPEVRALAYQLIHERTGARLIHLACEDPENLFSVSFPTPPADDTGVPHILEHCVLAGSRKFPVREPFFEMVKVSMATFINAMTGSDCTYYPVASNVKKDLFNLADVYFDAVFHPLLTEQTFRREGHHLAPNEEQTGTPQSSTNGTGVGATGLKISGIVYNEMKGVFSDPESRLDRALSRMLLPETIYAHESGGDPAAIPSLTFDDFTNFHTTYYHPSNAYFLAYGDVPLAEYCSFIDARLGDFERRPVAIASSAQTRWSAPRQVTERYPISADEPTTEKTYLSLLWLVGDTTDPVDAALLRVLSLMLGGNEAAPLRKALVESKLGADVTGLGGSSIGREATFGVGLKGSEPDRAPAFLELVEKTLLEVAAAGITNEMVETAFSQAAFSFLEVEPMFPLHTLFRVLSTWIYDVDPLTYLNMGRHLQTCRERWEAEPGIFARLIHERLLDNSHRVLATMQPDRALQGEIDAEEVARVHSVAAELDDADKQRIVEQVRELEVLNGTPNSPEALARLPQLRVTDLPQTLQNIPTTVSDAGGIALLRNDVLANGVNYLSLDIDLNGLPTELWPFVPYYLDAVDKLGAGDERYDRIAQRKASATGGVRSSLAISTHSQAERRVLTGVRMGTKFLDAQLEPALAVFEDILFGTNPRDFERLHDILVQGRAHMRTSLTQNGAGTAGLHVARGLSAENQLAEATRGLPQLELIESLTEDSPGKHATLMSRIEEIRDFLLRRDAITASFTGTGQVGDRLATRLSTWHGRLSNRTAGAAVAEGFTPDRQPRYEGLAAQLQVAYSAQVLPAPRYAEDASVALSLGAHLMTYDYMYPEVRFKGNAYGAWFRYDALGGEIALGSYRDPNIALTLDVFRDAVDFARDASWSQADIDRAIIAVAKRDQAPLRPRPANGLALQRHLVGIHDTERERRFGILKSLTPDRVKQGLVAALEPGLAVPQVCVVSSREKLAAANAELDADRQLAIEDINKH